MSDAEVLMKAALLIQERGLARGDREDDKGRLCAHGAAAIAAGGTAYSWPVAEGDIMLRVFGQNLGPWNNDPDTTQDEVVALLQSGAYSLDPPSPTADDGPLDAKAKPFG